MIDKIYHGFLWLCGFQNKEHISDMLARTKIRLGFWWYVLVTATFGAAFYGLVLNVHTWWKVLIFVVLLIFLGWLFGHILGYKPREETRRFTRKYLTHY